MSYRVTAACVIAKDQGGHSHHFYEGAVVPWLSDVQAQHLLDENMVVEVDGGASESVGPPAKTAPKPEWVAYVVAKTANTDKPVTEAEADALNKPDLIDLYGD